MKNRETIEILKQKIKGFKNESFTDGEKMDMAFTVMPENKTWGKPSCYPTLGVHPRVGITRDLLLHIKNYTEKTKEGKFLYGAIKQLATSDFMGVLDEPYIHETGRRGFHNVDEHGLAVIEARAFLYLLTGDKEYGYSAILSMKNYLSKLYFGFIYSDQCREIGRTVFVTAEIYDWCYPLLTDSDKEQFIISATFWCSGNAEKRYGGKFAGLCGSGNRYMEVSYPPEYQHSVSGHGSEAQILRDYYAISIAIFDENPSWYNYVGARIFNEFIPFRNHYFQSGMYPQGVNMYAPHRFTSDMWCAWLSITALGKNPYTDDLQRTANGFLDYRLPDGTFFGAGDGVRQKKISANMMYSMAMAAAIYDDSRLRGAVLEFYNADISTMSPELITTVFSLVHHTVFGAEYFFKHGSTDTSDIFEGKEVVRYHPYPIGEMISRRKWNDINAAASFMFVGEKSTANHDHSDAGTFQLSYKDLQFVDAGVYDKYGSAHWRYYHQATVGHNGLLFFDPDSMDEEIGEGSFSNPRTLERYFYSGGQRNFYSSGYNLTEWLNSEETNTAKVSAYDYRLNSDGTCDYAYLSGDITKAYTSEQVARVERKMLTLYTDDPKMPMYFVVYDSASVSKPEIVSKFLLHAPVEPLIDNTKKVVSFWGKEAKLHLHALKGTEKIESIGGEGAECLVNGKRCAGERTEPDGMWGRIELSNTGKTEHKFLNVLYFTDADNGDDFTPILVEGENYVGALLGSVAVIFADEGDALTLNVKEAKRYILCGLRKGLWTAEFENKSMCTCSSKKDEGIIDLDSDGEKIFLKYNY